MTLGRIRAGSGRTTLALVGLVSLAVFPIVASLVALVGAHWFPTGDQAIEVLRIQDVGGPDTPLLGPWSRWGWAHPGPLLFWVLAPFERVLGVTGVLAGIALINLAAVAGAVLVAYRRGGLHLAAVTALFMGLMVHALGLGALLDPWNPRVAFLPFVLFLLLVWSVVCLDLTMLPLAVAVGTFAVQSHVGYLPVVGGLMAAAAVAVAATLYGRGDGGSGSGFGRRAVRAFCPAARWITVAVVVGVVLWIPPLIEQFTVDEGDDGNLSELVYQFRFSEEPEAGWEEATGVFGTQLHPLGPWFTGDDSNVLGFARTTEAAPAALAVLGAVALGVWAWRRGLHDAARLTAVATVAIGLSLLATAKATGFLYPYVVKWWWGVAFMVWLGVIWAVWGAIGNARVLRGAAIAGVVGLAVVVAVTLQGPLAPLPEAGLSEVVGAVGDPTADALDPDQRYLVRAIAPRSWGTPREGLYLHLDGRGHEVYVEERRDSMLMYGERRLADPDDVDGIVTIVETPAIEGGWEPPAGSRLIASYDPRPVVDQEHYDRVVARVRADMGAGGPAGRVSAEKFTWRDEAIEAGASPDDIDELEELTGPVDGFAVFLSPGGRG